MTREKALLELQTLYKKEGRRHVKDLQETLEREAIMDALEVAIDALEIKTCDTEEDTKTPEDLPFTWGEIGMSTTPLSEAVNAAKERLLSNPHINPVYQIFKALNADSEPLTANGLPGTSEPLKVKVKYFADIDPIEELPQGSWIDLRCAKDVHLPAGGYAQIPLGVAMELPDGYEAVVAPRSSTFRKYGVILVNSLGVIDPDYRGDGDQWHFLAYAIREAVIPKNDRICQFRILPRQPKMEFLKVDHLGNPDRGGIGSTGRT